MNSVPILYSLQGGGLFGVTEDGVVGVLLIHLLATD